MEQKELIPHLFRTAYSETFLLAFETWSYKGIPTNPTAWLYVVAKN